MRAERFGRIDDILGAALEREEGARPAFLDSACAGDDELRSEVESLLAAHGRAVNFIESNALEVLARAAARRAEPDRVGRSLGPYKILSPLGAGGMGEVYLAEDVRLNRRVALKLLPAAFTDDPERVRRFEREAHAASALNHPNIVTIHEVGEWDGVHFIATEFVEGRTLRSLIAGEGLKVGDALSVASQVAEALAAAHAAGIIHRDIKPENIMLRPDGYAKVLDFGIAKLTERGAPPPDASRDPSEGAETETGAVVGTVAYMSPEQALGQKLDQRTDVFSLGVVLYEMLTGEHPFRGATNAATFDRILNHHPPTPIIPDSDAATELERVVCRALEKSRELRHQTAADLRAELKILQRALDSTPPVSAEVNGTVASPRRARGLLKRAAVVALSALLVALAAAAVYLAVRPAESPASAAAPSLNFTQLTDQPGQELFPSLSPDGKALVYAARGASDDWNIYWQRVGGRNPRNLTENSPADDTQPAFSPDGEYVVFRSEREKGGLFIMGATGESVRRLTDFGFFPAWSPDGREVAFSTEGFSDPTSRRPSPSMVWVVNVSTGERRQLTDAKTGDAAQPAWSPDGARIAYWGKHKGGQRDIWTIPARGGEPAPVTDDAAFDWNPVWSPDGRFLYFASDRGGSMNLWRVPMEEQTGRPTGPPEPLTTPSTYAQQVAFSRDGRRAAYVNQVSSTNIFTVDFNPYKERITGEPVAVTQGFRHASGPDLSPDGGWFVYSSQGERQEDLYLVSRDGASPPRKLTDDAYKDRGPRWSPDGKSIAFYSDRSGRYEAWTINADGGGLRQLTFTEGPSVYYPFWSPDSARIAYNRSGETCTIIEVGKSWQEQTPHRLPDPADRRMEKFWATSWSPDGRKLGGWVSPESETPGVAVYDFETGGYERITDFGNSPIWLSDNRRLLFDYLHKLYLVNSKTKKVQELLPPSPHRVSGYGLSPDGRTLYYGLAVREADVWLLDLD
ncbi:MAG: eukaryotic-like serine/threonine-protein kinase [Acidobacteriota bacterium]|jgi:Tol biopolymer transport system component/serine/threonine protein kinase|nr:eukaryotic-like serine/threonine-protein kinase [Acidobacteriota bacterium]